MNHRRPSEIRHLSPKERAKRIDLGLQISRWHCRPGEGLTLNHIAAFCGTTDSTILAIEKRALRKLRTALKFRHDPVLKALTEDLFRK